jgi:subfamily B ATP-binding cassette protein HlyB/CyaB
MAALSGVAPEIHRNPEADVSGLDSGLQCLLIISRLQELTIDEAILLHEFGRSPFTAPRILIAAKQFGMVGRVVRQDPQRWAQAPLPAIAVEEGGRYCVVAKYSGGAAKNLLIYRPGSSPEAVSTEEFQARWTGELIYLAARGAGVRENARVDFSWFIPAVIKYRRVLGEVLLMSLVLQIIGLATPLFFQVVMDKVLVNHAVQTLNVIAVGLFFAILFESALSGIRSYVFAHTTSKLDVELGVRLFKHLLALPIGYFQSRRVGDSVARVRELEQIRAFLTGNALTLVLDIAFSFVFLGVMFCYSARLTLYVMLAVPAYALLSIIFTPVLRARLNDRFNRSAENQAFLVETISGIETLKAMAVEPSWMRQWERQLASYVRSGLSATTTGLFAGTGVRLVSRLVTLAIVWAGAWRVMDGELTVGELIAFNMLAAQVASPILRLAQMWNDFQQVGVSMERLGDILNARPEVGGPRAALPRIEGGVDFDQVSFRYRPDASEVLRGMSFRVKPGEVLGIVGRSGSGKSTITKLIQRLYVPERGRILIDGHDVAVIDAASLRAQIGVVLQENVLFNRSVRENIALANPLASMEEIIAVAKLAGAHEFICELPEGYDSQVGENGTGLSGGQRQRVALARALLKDPRILIMDEATSALDYESERIIQEGMDRICRGRTVIIVAHRLSAVRNADRILVLERGEIAEVGTQAELLSRPAGLYARLHRMQTRTGLTEVIGA